MHGLWRANGAAWTPDIRDVVGRPAGARFVAGGAGGLSSIGGDPGTEDMKRTLDQHVLPNNTDGGFEQPQALGGADGEVGGARFTCGGGVMDRLAVACPEMPAGVPF